MPNPSEMQRLLEEEEDLKNTRIDAALALLQDLKFNPHKAIKEQYLRELRRLERELGIESTPYSNNNFIERSRDALLHLRRGIE